jgi:hypothetical protein
VLKVRALNGYLDDTAGAGTPVRIAVNPDSAPMQILVDDMDLVRGMPPATYQYLLTGDKAEKVTLYTVFSLKTINICFSFAIDQRGYLYMYESRIANHPPNYTVNITAIEVDTVPILHSDSVTITIHVLTSKKQAPISATSRLTSPFPTTTKAPVKSVSYQTSYKTFARSESISAVLHRTSPFPTATQAYVNHVSTLITTTQTPAPFELTSQQPEKRGGVASYFQDTALFFTIVLILLLLCKFLHCKLKKRSGPQSQYRLVTINVN